MQDRLLDNTGFLTRWIMIDHHQSVTTINRHHKTAYSSSLAACYEYYRIFYGLRIHCGHSWKINSVLMIEGALQRDIDTHHQPATTTLRSLVHQPACLSQCITINHH